MLAGLTVGVRAEVMWKTTEELCTRRGDYDIFSTPSMVRLLEAAGIEALKPYLTEGEASVGTWVDIRHMAPTLKGMNVRAVASVSQVDRQRVVFAVEIFDDVEKVGEATHERFVLDLDRYARRLEQKRTAATS